MYTIAMLYKRTDFGDSGLGVRKLNCERWRGTQSKGVNWGVTKKRLPVSFSLR